jgi:serine/threonine protein kinase
VKNLLSKLSQTSPSCLAAGLTVSTPEEGNSQASACGDVLCGDSDPGKLEKSENLKKLEQGQSLDKEKRPENLSTKEKLERLTALDALADIACGHWLRVSPELWTLERVARPRLGIVDEIKRHRVVLLLLLSLILSVKSIIGWLIFVAGWSVCEKVYPLLPGPLRAKCDVVCTPPISALREGGWFDELEEAVAYTRPFFIFALYIFFAPVALCWIGCHWLRHVFSADDADIKVKSGGGGAATVTGGTIGDGETLIFVQNKNRDLRIHQTAFFHSPAFALTAIFLFAGGLPAAVTLSLYDYLQIDSLLGFPSHDPQFFWVIVVICFYFTSLAWCASVLFFRAWFTFPLNFLTNEHELELNSRRIKRRAHKGWFLSIVTMNNPAVGTSSIDWKEVTTVNARNGTGTRFYPLPEAAFRGAPPAFKRVLNRIALLYDSVAQKIDQTQFVTISTAQGLSNWGREIDINLSELSGDERAKLFYAIRKWAPLAVVSEEAQTRMIGSCVMREPKYTEIWFDLLTQKHDPHSAGRARLSELKTGDLLHDRTLQVIERLASGGQATAYLARYTHEKERPLERCPAEQVPSEQIAAGQSLIEQHTLEQKQSDLCVLKEFILSDSDAVGALIQSAAEFEVEASLLSQLDHPRVVKLFDCFSEDRRVYLILEYAPGISLRRMVKESGPLSAEKVTQIALQLCDVVAYLHSLNPPLVHRDLAPDNIIYDQESGVKLIDFSLACSSAESGPPLQEGVLSVSGASASCLSDRGKHGRLMTGSGVSSAPRPAGHTIVTQRTSTGLSVGKHAYTPPEQFRDEATVQSDIYALGATLYFLLTGHDPKPLTCSNPGLRNADIPPYLCTIVERATELDPLKRYEEISWLRLDLEGH